MINEIMVLGVILSIVFYEITEISPGGLIVPAYFALYLDNPTKIILTIFIIIIFIIKGSFQLHNYLWKKKIYSMYYFKFFDKNFIKIF